MPLLSLIEDNINFVKDLGIPAIALSATSKSEEKKVGNSYKEILNLSYKLVYLTPERLVKSPGLIKVLDELYESN